MKKPIALILAIIMVVGLTACGDSSSDSKQNNLSTKMKDCEYVEKYIEDNVLSEVLENISKLFVNSSDDEKMSVTVRLVSSGGSYIPQAATEICPLVIEAIALVP